MKYIVTVMTADDEEKEAVEKLIGQKIETKDGSQTQTEFVVDLGGSGAAAALVASHPAIIKAELAK